MATTLADARAAFRFARSLLQQAEVQFIEPDDQPKDHYLLIGSIEGVDAFNRVRPLIYQICRECVHMGFCAIRTRISAEDWSMRFEREV